MSKVIIRGLAEVGKSKYDYLENGNFRIQNAFIFWTNFSGKENSYKNKTRNFMVAVIPEVAKDLEANGWRVKAKTVTIEDDTTGEQVGETLYFVNVKINMAVQYPPIISLYTDHRGKRVRTAIDVETIGTLDSVRYERVDLTINPYISRNFPDKVTGYLKTLSIIKEKEDDDTNIMYDDWLEGNDAAFDEPLDN